MPIALFICALFISLKQSVNGVHILNMNSLLSLFAAATASAVFLTVIDPSNQFLFHNFDGLFDVLPNKRMFFSYRILYFLFPFQMSLDYSVVNFLRLL